MTESNSEQDYYQRNKELVQRYAKTLQEDEKKSKKLAERSYYNPADFSSLELTYGEMSYWNSTLIEILETTPDPENPVEEIVLEKLMNQAYKYLKKAVHRFTFEWPQQTAGFMGSKNERKEVYELLIDEAKAIMTIATPPDRQQLETVVLALNHILEWLISEAFPYSAGEITQATHPQLFNLEQTQLRTGMPGASIAEVQESRLSKWKKKIPFTRASKPSEDEYSRYVPDKGGMD
jgi:hypothetical protein